MVSFSVLIDINNKHTSKQPLCILYNELGSKHCSSLRITRTNGGLGYPIV